MDRHETTTSADPLAATAESLDDLLLRRDLKKRLFGSGAPVHAGRYELEERIGTGGMGVVYAARDPELDRKIALKLLLPGKPSGRERMLREAKAMARLSHPNVVTVHEVGTHDERVFVAMEFVHGPTLRQWLETARTVPQILDVFRQAAIGLHAAHRAGLVHRDFKPDNVLIGDDGWVKVADFGLAKAALEPEALPPAQSEAALELTITRTGALLGTPAYMAPEQFLGRPVERTSDVFSFSVALYEALAGRRPFGGEDAVAVFNNVIKGRREPLRAAGVSPRVLALVEQGLAGEPGERPQSLQPFIDALGGAAPRRASRGVVVAAAVVTLGLGGLAIYGTLARAPADEPASETVAEENAIPSIVVVEKPPAVCTPYVPDRSDIARAREHSERALTALRRADLSSASSVPHVLEAARGLVDQDDIAGACDVLGGYLTTTGDRRDDAARCLFAQVCADLPPRCAEGSTTMGTAGCVLDRCTAGTAESQAQACDSGEAACCLPAAHGEENTLDGWALDTKGCQAGSALACAQAAVAIPTVAKRPEGPGASVEAVGFWTRACRLGLRRACEMVAPGHEPPSAAMQACIMTVDHEDCTLDRRDPELLRNRAVYLTVQAEYPNALGAESLRPYAEKLGFPADAIAGLERAEKAFREDAEHTVDQCLSTLKSPKRGDDEPIGRDLQQIRYALANETRWGQERWEAVAQQVADERAGLVEPRAESAMVPEERCHRLLLRLGDMLEDRIAAEIGRERARQLRVPEASWAGTQMVYVLRSP